MQPKRSSVLDVAKGLGIILVVYAHVNYQYDMLTLIYSFHMPLFFIISGMLYNKSKYPDFKSFFTKRFKTLFIPYVLFEMASIFLLYASENIYSQTGLFDISKEQYIEYAWQIVISNWSGTHVNQPLWFVPCLLLVEILYFFVSRLPKKYTLPIAFVFACCGWILESGLLFFDNKLLPWSLDSALFAFGFYAIGNLVSVNAQDTIKKISFDKNKVSICLILIAVTMLIWCPLGFVNGKITLGSKILGNGFLLYINGILGTITILAISILLQKNKFLAFCGRNSFYIMSTHYILRNMLVKPIYVLIAGELYNKESFIETLIPFILVFLLSLLYTIIHINIKKHIQFKKKL